MKGWHITVPDNSTYTPGMAACIICVRVLYYATLVFILSVCASFVYIVARGFASRTGGTLGTRILEQ